MTVDVPSVRPAVVSLDVAGAIDEFLRFRHVVRHIYAFQLDPERIEGLATRLLPVFHEVSEALLAFSTYLDRLAREA
jgi:hypothetical protein